jgi:hypothetical protein
MIGVGFSPKDENHRRIIGVIAELPNETRDVWVCVCVCILADTDTHRHTHTAVPIDANLFTRPVA